MGKVRLANVLNNLKMDKNLIDATKAKEYLATHKDFRSDSSITAPENLEFDSFNNSIYCLQQDSIENLLTTPQPNLPPGLLSDRSNGLRKLADEIEQNFDLICQLEYLIRGIPVPDTKHSIHLILQHLRFSSDNELVTKEQVYFIERDTPLLAFGCYFQKLKLYDFSYLYATKETAVICHLFTELCHKATLHCLKLVISDSKKVSDKKFTDLFNDFMPDICGIIMEKSDVNSAVDIFLNSERHPFPLTQIFVQESVYHDFKEIIAWKCRSQQKNNTSLNTSCTEAYHFKNKTFYLDYAGDIKDAKTQNGQLIFVEAFRTVNEVLALLNKSRRSLCLSLWASSVSEANEIAHNMNTPIIWINDYCNFDGPSEVSQAIFDKTFYNSIISTEKSVVEHLTQQQKAWSKKTHSERYEKVINAFESVNKNIGNALKEKDNSYWKFNSFIALQDKTMVMGLYLPIPVVSFNWSHELLHNIDDPKMIKIWLSIAKALINGSAIGYSIDLNISNDSLVEIIMKLTNSGLPLAKIKNADPSDLKYKMTNSYYAESVQAKVIWTSFGTVFAN